MTALLDGLKEAGANRIFTVLGCDGETTNKTMRTQVCVLWAVQLSNCSGSPAQECRPVG